MDLAPIAVPARAAAALLRAADSFPDRFTVMSLLRAAAPGLGLRPPVLATLDAMLSCLPPRRLHHVVFAANATLLARTGGTCDRTLRRHAALLVAVGLIRRRDSANGKRFARRGPEGMAAFGFDLAPLFDRVAELAARAAEARAAAEHVAVLRARLRAAVQARLAADPADAPAQAARALLRRKPDAGALSDLCDALEAAPALPAEAAANDGAAPALSANDGRIVRHHQKSETEPLIQESGIAVAELLAACPAPAAFAAEPLARPDQVLRHARMLAPMMGIDSASYAGAEARIGPVATALTVWLVLQLGDRVQRVGAYFRAVTSGSRSAGFDPAAVIGRMARRLSADNPPRAYCPRTT